MQVGLGRLALFVAFVARGTRRSARRGAAIGGALLEGKS